MTATPIYDAVVRERAGREARAIVRTGLLACPACRAGWDQTCRTRSGKPTKPHRGRPLKGVGA